MSRKPVPHNQLVEINLILHRFKVWFDATAIYDKKAELWYAFNGFDRWQADSRRCGKLMRAALKINGDWSHYADIKHLLDCECYDEPERPTDLIVDDNFTRWLRQAVDYLPPFFDDVLDWSIEEWDAICREHENAGLRWPTFCAVYGLNATKKIEHQQETLEKRRITFQKK